MESSISSHAQRQQGLSFDDLSRRQRQPLRRTWLRACPRGTRRGNPGPVQAKYALPDVGDDRHQQQDQADPRNSLRFAQEQGSPAKVAPPMRVEAELGRASINGHGSLRRAVGSGSSTGTGTARLGPECLSGHRQGPAAAEGGTGRSRSVGGWSTAGASRFTSSGKHVSRRPRMPGQRLRGGGYRRRASPVGWRRARWPRVQPRGGATTPHDCSPRPARPTCTSRASPLHGLRAQPVRQRPAASSRRAGSTKAFDDRLLVRLGGDSRSTSRSRKRSSCAFGAAGKRALELDRNSVVARHHERPRQRPAFFRLSEGFTWRSLHALQPMGCAGPSARFDLRRRGRPAQRSAPGETRSPGVRWLNKKRHPGDVARQTGLVL